MTLFLRRSLCALSMLSHGYRWHDGSRFTPADAWHWAETFVP